MKESVAMYSFLHMHASMRKRLLRTPRIYTFTYLKYYVYIYIYIKESVAIYFNIYTSLPPCRNVSLESLGLYLYISKIICVYVYICIYVYIYT